MAIIWRKIQDGVDYQVRGAGKTRRLYTNGVFHSQFNPTQPLTGGVWDLLMLPAFFRPDTVRRVLVLGVGGGAVIRQLHYFLAPQTIIGVELNSVHLYVANRFFGLRQSLVDLHHADAHHWLANYSGSPFDLIIDDIFGEERGEPVRAIAPNSAWFNRLLAHLNPGGIISMNFISGRELRQSAYFNSEKLASRFKSAFQLTTPLHENAVGVFSRADDNSSRLRKNLSKIPGLDPRKKTTRLHYHIRKI